MTPRFFHNYSLLTLILLWISAAWTEGIEYCVLGGGAAGITTAYFLKQKGRSVRIIEKESHLFGKTKLFQASDGLNYTLGAVLTDVVTPTVLTKLLEEFNIPTFPLPNKDRRQVYLASLDPPQVVDIPADPQILPLLQQYDAVTAPYRSLLADFNYTDPALDPIKTTTAYDFLVSNGLQQLEGLFFALFTGFGYGKLEDVPALYMIQTYTGTNLLGNALGGDASPTRGVFFQKLLEALVEDIPVTTDTLVTKIVHDGKRNYLHTNNRRRPIKCKKVVVAFPPVGDISFLPHDERDLAVFKKLVSFDYYSALVDATSPPRVVQYQTIPQGMPLPLEPLIYANLFEPSSFTIQYLLSQIPGSTDGQVQSAMTMGAEAVLQATNPQILDFNRWNPYFTHVPVGEMTGFFEEVQALQGQKNVYFVGSILSMESVRFIVQQAFKFVESLHPTSDLVCSLIQ